MMKTIALLLAMAVLVKPDIQGPACADNERYECGGSVVPVPDPNDCTVFYNCDAQIQRPCPQVCPDGLLYDINMGICNWPADAVTYPGCTA